MNRYAMVAAATVLVAGAHLSSTASAVVAASDGPAAPGGVSTRGAKTVGSAAAYCDLPAVGWSNCQVVKALPDDMVYVALNGSHLDDRVDCNLNELGTNDQLNANTAMMWPGQAAFLWHNNYGKTVYADLRCAGFGPFPIWANLEVWRE